MQFEAPVTGEDGKAYLPRVCGREADDGLWEGWIEFDPQKGEPVLRTPRETRQPNRRDLEYWATGLTHAYLEGALHRALNAGPRVPRPLTGAAKPTFDRPAPSPVDVKARPLENRTRPRTVLDPFKVYAQGEHVLREELGALNEGHLRNLIRGYDLVEEEELDLQALSRAALAEMIVAAVRRRAG